MTKPINLENKEALHKVIRVGRWNLTPDTRSISCGSKQFTLSASSAKLLLLLFQNAGNVIDKEGLISQVWQGVLVSEDSLTKAVSELRKIFAQDKSSSVRIVTIRGIGYKLLYVSSRHVAIKKFVGVFGVLALLVSVILYTSGFFDLARNDSINITNNYGEQRGPRISPDGSRVLYSSISAGWNNFDIHVQHIEEKQSMSLVESDAVEMDPAWSPDGQTIVYVKQDHKHLKIVTQNLNNNLVESITTLQSGSGLSLLDWSANRKTIVFSDRLNQGPLAIFEIDPLDKTSRVQTTTPKAGLIGDHSPKISPDGSKMAFIRISKKFPFYQHLIPGEGEVFIKYEGGLKKLTNLSSAISGISWIDEDHLVFSVAHNFFSFRIYEINIDSGEKKVLYESENIIRNLDFNPSLKSLAFEAWDLNHKIWKVWRNEKGLYLAGSVFNSEENEWNPSISPDGLSLAFMSDRDGTSLLLEDLHDKKQGAVRLDSGAIGNLSWSSNGEKLLYEKLTSDSSHIYTYDKLTKARVLHASTLGRYAFPFWSEDYKSIYFVVNTDKQSKLFKLKMGASIPEVVNTDMPLSKGAYVNGELLHSSLENGGLWSQKPVDNRSVFPDLNIQDNLNWVIHNQVAYMITRDPFFRSTLTSFNLQTKTQETLFTLPNPVAVDFAGLSISPASDAFYVTLNVQKRSDIILLEGF